MKSLALMPLLLAAAPAPPAAQPVLSPPEIVDAAPKADWVAIAPQDLLVMELAAPAQGPGQASAKGKPRRVVIQLMPPPFSQGWVGNIRKLAAAHWWDGLSVNRVQDNYVVQWGDADGEDPKKAKALPKGLLSAPVGKYLVFEIGEIGSRLAGRQLLNAGVRDTQNPVFYGLQDPYGFAIHDNGWPLASNDLGHKLINGIPNLSMI